jgi:hypothetical protein
MSRFLTSHFALVVAGASLCGCQIYPYEGEIIATTTSSISFEGCTTSPNQSVDFQRQDRVRGFSLPFDSILSSSSVNYTDSQGNNWYCWSKTETIPSDAWRVYGLGHRANVRTTLTDQQSPTWFFYNDPGQCNQPPGAASMTNQVPCALAPGQRGGIDWTGICAGSCD